VLINNSDLILIVRYMHDTFHFNFTSYRHTGCYYWWHNRKRNNLTKKKI